jgi:hypothetical protein
VTDDPGADVAADAGPEAAAADGRAIQADTRSTLPSARQLIASGIDLSMHASTPLRTASLAIGFQLLGALGPFVVLLIVVAVRAESFLDLMADPQAVADPAVEAVAGPFSVTAIIGGLALIALSLEGRIVAVAILGSRLAGRPLSPLEALRRSRQVFWRALGATLLVQLLLAIVGVVAGQVIDPLLGVTEAALVADTAIRTVASTPFVYVLAGIVLGGAPVGLAIRRSNEMAGVRWRLAFVASVAETLAQTLLVFAVLAGLDILARVAEALGLGLEAGDPSTYLTIVIALLGTAAVGSLLFTVGAIAAAPAVVAFVGLTGYAGALEGARDGTSGSRPVRWLSVPMGIGMAIALLASVAGISAVINVSDR